ncbi:MAG: hypothetical protein IPJ41_09405 [Phycisphaerales bacterium]|nr:hypothetical protein [Phycisphaerales bacterium]
MRRENAVAVLITVGALASLAAAQDYGDRNSEYSVKPTSEASLTIGGFANGNWQVLNAGGDVGVPISDRSNPMFVELGKIDVETSAQTDVVEAAWWESILPTGQYLQFVYRTQGGHDFVPFGAKKGGKLIQAYAYQMGADGNGVDFYNWVTHVDWQELDISYSYDGGQTVFSDPTIYNPIGEDAAWNGTDNMHLGLAFPGDGVNWIQASYKISPVPAPASALALLLPALGAYRRRR